MIIPKRRFNKFVKRTKVKNGNKDIDKNDKRKLNNELLINLKCFSQKYILRKLR